MGKIKYAAEAFKPAAIELITLCGKVLIPKEPHPSIP
jgi:hypothetical protein